MKFRLSATVGVSAYTDVEADSLEEAKKIAEARPVVLCPLGAKRHGADENEQWIVGEADGEAVDIHMEPT